MKSLSPPGREGTGIPLPGRRGALLGALGFTAAAALPALAAPNPDARLIALCDALIRGMDEVDAIWAHYYDVLEIDLPAAERERSDTLIDRYHRMKALVGRIPAKTTAGLRAKARMIARDLYHACDPAVCGIPNDEDVPTYTFARDVLAILGRG